MVLSCVVSFNISSICLYFIYFLEKLAGAKEENLGMHQVLDQTLQELNSL